VSLQGALATVWAEQRDTVRGQVGVLEAAVDSLSRGALGESLRADAEREAHKLAGSLGTFGFAKGSEHARRLEEILERPEALGRARVQTLSDHVAGLRSEIDISPDQGHAVSPVEQRDDAPLILIVDDDRELAGRLATEAARRGMRVDVALTPTAARDLVARERPDAVVLDLTFPDGTREAYELLSELAGATPAVPVLVLTVREGFTDRMEVARRGASGFLQKSLPVSAAIDQVAQFLERDRSVRTPVLAVDDDPMIRAGLQAILEPHGMAVTTVDDPMRFWDELERVTPALVLLDVDMPGASGIELCRTLRNDSRWAAVAVLFLTSRRDTETIQAIFAAGADDYMIKPIIEAELVTRVNNRLERFRLHQALAETDSLTGLPNRRTSRQSLGQLLRLADRYDQPLCVAELDIDHFKQINDRYGHAAGDFVLRRLGELLRRTFRGDDVVARWGGEEFVVGMYGMATEDGVQRMAGLLEAFRQEEFHSEDERFHVSFSAGVAQFPSDGADIDSLYGAADEALYRAKAAGRDRVLGASRTTDEASDLVDVVIVEDDELIGGLLTDTLRTRGFSSRWIQDGAQAAEQLTGAALRARVVLLDVDLPGLNGREVLRRLGHTGVLRTTRVVMLTGRASETEVLSCLELGATDHVAKPFSVPVLMHKVRKALES
jgi:diguanylate cyclase (GGDEF)-like protein